MLYQIKRKFPKIYIWKKRRLSGRFTSPLIASHKQNSIQGWMEMAKVNLLRGKARNFTHRVHHCCVNIAIGTITSQCGFFKVNFNMIGSRWSSSTSLWFCSVEQHFQWCDRMELCRFFVHFTWNRFLYYIFMLMIIFWIKFKIGKNRNILLHN